MSPEPRRRLIYFPILHTPEDMGALRERVERLTVERLGRVGWQRTRHLVDRLWSDIERTLALWKLDYGRTRVYQDGLPQCGREVEIVRELARAGNRNHQLLLGLHERGAVLMGTEAAELLTEEYELVKAALAGGGDPAHEQPVRDAVLARRDRHIAGVIASTLQPGETGILFLGMLHNVAPHLPPDIEIVFPLGVPRGGRP